MNLSKMKMARVLGISLVMGLGWKALGQAGETSNAHDSRPRDNSSPSAQFPDMAMLTRHVQNTKSELMTPEKLFKHIAADVEASRLDLAFAHFSPSDTNWDFLRSLNGHGRKQLADALRKARVHSTGTEPAMDYEMPFLEQDGTTTWPTLGLFRGPDGVWSIISW